MFIQPDDPAECYRCKTKELILREKDQRDQVVCVSGCGIDALSERSALIFGAESESRLHVFILTPTLSGLKILNNDTIIIGN